MAASMLCRRAAVLCQTLTGISPPNSLFYANSKCGLVFQTATYNPKPLKLNINRAYIPDKDDEKTPQWQKTAKYDAKLYGRYGSVSGVDPASLWPSPARLDAIIADENEWHPPLEVMLKNIAAKEAEETAKRLAKEQLIAANMAKMPKMIEDWRREKRETKQKQKEQKAQRSMLMARARERFGHGIDPRSPKFLEMVAELEAEEKKQKKLMKRRLKEEKAAAAAPPPVASS